MPIYEYECENCQHRYDVRCRITEADEKKICPACSSEQSKRRISRVNFELRGGGWYKDGYSKGG
jgi:putative FmdB family regulatory protein